MISFVSLGGINSHLDMKMIRRNLRRDLY
jgi:hypothetical protein